MNDETKNQDGDMPQADSPASGNASDQELARIFMPPPNAEQLKAAPETTGFAEMGISANLPDNGPAKIWFDVPDGSVLELRVASQNPFAAAVARFSTQAGKFELWPQKDILPGPKIRPLVSVDSKYVLNIIVSFDGNHNGKVAIFAKAIRAGTVVETYFHVVGGALGDIKLSRILIEMQ